MTTRVPPAQGEIDFRELVEGASDLIYTQDLMGRITWANSAVERVLGWTREHFVTLTIEQVIAQDFLQTAHRVLYERLTDRMSPYALVMLHRDGTRVQLEVSSRYFYRGGQAADEGAEVVGVMSIARDVSEKVRAAKALKASEDRFRGLVEQSLAGIYVIDGRGGDPAVPQVSYGNPRFAEIFGYTVEEVTGQLTVADLVAEPDRAIVTENLRKRLSGEVPSVRYEFRGLKKDGSIIYCEVNGIGTHLEGRRAVIGTMIDVTERKRAEEAVRESEERYALAAQGANDGLWDWDLRTGQIYLSPRWKQQTGTAGLDLGDDPNVWIGRVHSDNRARLLGDIALHLEGRTPHLENEHRVRHEDGSWRWMLVRGLAVRSKEGRAYRMAGSQTDITDRKRAEEKLLHDTLHDALTGLPNRTLFLDRLGQAMAFGRRRSDYKYAVVFLDLDRFKTINDSLGHSQGDQLLIAVARRLLSCVRPGDTVARLGGDEFAILLEDYLEPDEPLRVTERIHAELAHVHDLAGTEVFVGGSAGVAAGHPGYHSPEEILRDADTAMYRAKEAGRSRTISFQQAMHVKARALLQIETDLRRALERTLGAPGRDTGELKVLYQPVVSLQTGQIVGCEALCSWIHPNRGRIPPTSFIPVAEETGLIVPIGAWVMREACKQAQGWLRELPKGAPLTMAVNLSARQMVPELLDNVSAALTESGLPSARLRLEITESVIMEHLAPAALLIAQLKARNVHLLLDDFGTGYSSLSYLHELKFDALKIDRSFVSRAESGKPAQIIHSIVGLGRSLGLELVAEGVETETQLLLLRSLGVEYAQGFYFSRPVDAATFERLLHEPLPWTVPAAPPPIAR